MWFEERSWSNLRMSELVEEWRDLWSFKIDFLVASISYVFATTNFLNLPKLILENGGLAFVAAYGAALLALVLPTIILELAVGQLTGRAPVLAFFNLSPIFKGVGVAQVLFSLVVLACMTRFLGWLIIYIYHLFWTLQTGRPSLPWLTCKNFPELLSEPCREAGSMANFTTANTKLGTLHSESTMIQFMNALERPSESIADFGEFQYYLLAAQGLVWIIVFCGICFGVRWLGKVIPFTFMAAFSMMLALLIRACTMDGLLPILEIYWKATNWNLLITDYMIWKVAIEQAILASGIGYGAYITIGSYNKRSNNLVGDSFVIVISHCVLTVMQVMVVIGLVGYVSLKTGLAPMELMDKGESQMWHVLAYFSYLPNPKVWTGLLLFASVFILLNIFYLLSLSVLATLEDALGERWSRCFPRFVLALFACSLIFSMSLYFTTQAGKHAYELATGFIQYITIFVILAFELFVTAWFYCAHRLGMDLHTMLKRACCWCLGHFILMFTYLLPAIPAAIAVLNAMKYDFSNFSPPIHAWPYSEYVGAAVALVPLLPIPLYFFGAFLRACCCKDKASHSQGERLKNVVRTRLRRDAEKGAPPPRYTSSAPGYLLLPQAPLAEPETYA